MEKRDNKERELKESVEQLARNTERYKEELVEGTADVVVQMNDVYKGIVEDSVAKNKELLAKMRGRRLQSPPPAYPGMDQPRQQPLPPAPQVVYQQ
jgi:hypothetical protein